MASMCDTGRRLSKEVNNKLTHTPKKYHQAVLKDGTSNKMLEAHLKNCKRCASAMGGKIS